VHVNSQGYTCNTCHNATASNNTTVTGFAIHVDKNVNIQIINTYTSVAGATYNGNAAAWNTIYAKAVGTTTGTCNTVSCHGGQSPNWGTINTGNAQCTSCHGVKPSTPAAYTADNRLAAPGWNTTGLNTWQTVGAQTNGVSNDAKVGAHRKHLGAYTVWGTIGYANDIACANCHTLYTAVTDAGHMNGSTALVWSSLARNSGTDYTTITGVLSPSFAGGTCSTVYCHGSGFWSSNRGSGLSVGWTSNAYITTVAQAADSASCQRCHLSPPVSNHAGTGAHPGATLSPGGCNSCHGHTGWGTSHIDGKLQASGGSCNSCHWYDTGGAAWTTTNGISGGTGLSMNAASWGAHTKHINHLKARWGSTLNAATDIYGSAAFNNVCGVCHDQTAASTHGPDGGPTTRQIGFNGSTARQFGASAPNWNTVTRSCSSLDCHYKPVNAWGSW
jgi:hypothetical protein